MKRIHWIEFNSILKRTWICFVTVFILTAAGVGVYTGFEWGVKAIGLSVDKVYSDQAFHSYEVFSSTGIEKDVPDKIKGAEAEGVFFAYRFFGRDGKRLQAKIYSITETIDILFMIEGRLPHTSSEIVLERFFAEQNGYAIGDRIRFEDDGNPYLTQQEFTVTALAESPAYLSNEPCTYGTAPDTLNPVDCLMFASPEAFCGPASAYYAEMLVSGDITKEALSSALAEASGKDSGSFTVLTADDNAAKNLVDNSIDSFRKLKISMGVMLILISQAVSFIFLEKVVDGQRKLIGMKKALGFTEKEVIRPYLLYGISSSFCGTVLGILLGRFVLESVFVDLNRSEVFIPEPVYCFSLPESFIIAGIEIVLSALVVYFAVRRVLSEKAVDLLNGRQNAPVFRDAAKRNGRQRPALTRAVINNIRTGRKQRFSMILCIAGCTLLLVSSLTVNDLVAGSFVRHFSAIQSYDTLVYFDKNAGNAPNEIRGILRKDGCTASLIHLEAGSIEDDDGKAVVADLFVPLDDEYGKMFTFLNAVETSEEMGRLENDGVRISQAYAEYYGIKAGDRIRYLSANGAETELAVNGVFEYYLQMPCIHMSPEAYRRAFGSEPEGNVFAVDTGKTGGAASVNKLQESDAYIVSSDLYLSGRRSFDNMSFVCITVVIIFTVLSVVMAVFVILTLILSAVEKRKREIIVMKANGIPRKKIIQYVFTDTAVYAVIGIALGNVGGYWFGRLTTKLLSGYTDCFLKSVSVPAILTGSAVSVLLVLVMSLPALRKANSFRIADISDVTD